MDEDPTYRHCTHCGEFCSARDDHDLPCPVEGCPGRMPVDPETEG